MFRAGTIWAGTICAGTVCAGTVCRLAAVLCGLALLTGPAGALVGGALPAGDGVAGAVIGIVGPHDAYCTATAIARELLLTAAHCVTPGTAYRLQYADAARPAVAIAQIDRHPHYDFKAAFTTGASADLALVRLAAPLPPDIGIAAIGDLRTPTWPGDSFTVVGGGAADDGHKGVIRAAALVSTVSRTALQLPLVDPATHGAAPGRGACTGDSGAPVFQDQGGTAKVVAVVSWASGPAGTPGCGGVTGALSLAPYRQWIVDTARNLGVAMVF